MKDTVFSEVQKMVTDAGLPKGMKLILQERGVETKGMNAAKWGRHSQNFLTLLIRGQWLNKKLGKGATFAISFLSFIVNLMPLKGAGALLKNTPEPIVMVALWGWEK